MRRKKEEGEEEFLRLKSSGVLQDKRGEVQAFACGEGEQEVEVVFKDYLHFRARPQLWE